MPLTLFFHDPILSLVCSFLLEDELNAPVDLVTEKALPECSVMEH